MRYCMGLDLDYAIASTASLNTEQRLGILKSMVDAGHDVTIMSCVKGSHLHVFDGESKGIFDNRWMTALHYDVMADPSQFDALFIEEAATNTMYAFSMPDGTECSYVVHVAETLMKVPGMTVVIYHHGYKRLAFPFNRIVKVGGEQDLSKLSKSNYKWIFRGFDGDMYDWVVWHHAQNEKLFREQYTTYYGRVPIRDYVFTYVGYSPTYDVLCAPRWGAEYDLVFVGHQRSKARTYQLKEFYADFNSLVVGKWKEEERDLVGSGVDWYGPSKYHGDVTTFYEKGVATVLITDNEYEELGVSTSRWPTTVRAGCLVMASSCIYNACNWVGDDFVVGTKNDVRTILEFVNRKELVDIVAYQRSLLHTWDEAWATVEDEVWPRYPVTYPKKVSNV